MKFVLSILLTALLSFAACLFLPWWSIAFAAFIVAVAIPQKPGKSFLSGFAALFFLWGGLSFWISRSNEHILAHKMSLLLFKIDNPLALIAATAIVGALTAGLAGLTGSFLRSQKSL